MNKGLVIGFAAAALAAMASLAPAGVLAGPLAREPQPAAPAERLATSMRAMGLDPDGAPQLRGRYYILHARDPRGTELRVLADAEDGEILSVLPVRPPLMSGPADAGAMPRIIHVPQVDDVEADDANQDDAGGDSAARSPRERLLAAPPRRSAAPPPEREAVTGATPPPPRADGKDTALTPVYPTPKFGPKAGTHIDGR